MISEESPSLSPAEARVVFNMRAEAWAEEAASVDRAEEIEEQDAWTAHENETWYEA